MGFATVVTYALAAASKVIVDFVSGDLTESTADVLVSSDDWDLTMGGGVSAAIHRAGGDRVALDAAKFIPAELGDVVVTTAGDLPAKYVFHAITTAPPGRDGGHRRTMSNEDLVAALTEKCLALVDSLGVASIAFPLLGTGTAGLDPEEVSSVMLGVAKETLVQQSRPLRVSFWTPQTSSVGPESMIKEFSEGDDDHPVVSDDDTPGDDADERTQVFISYSHDDKRRLNELVKMMAPLLTRDRIDLWVDTDIETGSKWRTEIDEALRRAKVAVLLISPSFLASDFVNEVELPHILSAAHHQDVRVIAVHESASLWQETDLREFQSANDPKAPLDGLRAPKRREMLVTICQSVKKSYEI